MSSLHMKHIEKSFGLHPVLGKVDFSVEPGEVHALLGVNGAGKSTLMKILTGQVQEDGGEIYIGERKLLITSPSDAIAEGIRIVVQEVDTALIPELTVAENITIDELVRGPVLISWQQRKKRARELLEEIGADIPVEQQVSSCTLVEKQMILIARAIAGKANFLILDEPTAPLSELEARKLFKVIRHLKGQGVGIIYISHRIPEIMEISDRVTILRDGQVVAVKQTKETQAQEIIRHMLGKSLSTSRKKTGKPTGKPLLQCDRFYVARTGQTISFTLHEGEILGIAGLVGAGKTETARALFGADPSSQEVRVKDRLISLTNPLKAIEAGICLVPEERRKEGVLVDFPLSQNLSLPLLQKFTRWGWIQKQSEDHFAQSLVNRLGIQAPSLSHPLRQLSGGNQQKVSIGKWMGTEANIFMFDEPTKGIDIGAKEEIFSLIQNLAEQGKGILYLTSDFSELLTLADRILVMYNGAIVRELRNEEATLEKIMHAATGGYDGTGTEGR